MNRPRWYCLACNASTYKPGWEWPEAVDMPAAELLLDSMTPMERTGAESLITPSTRTGEQGLLNGLLRIVSDGGDPIQDAYFIDIESSVKFAGPPREYLGCLTAARGKTRGWWVTNRGRRLSLAEIFRFQGFNLNDFSTKGIRQSDLGHMAGNAMSTNVIERLLSRALYHASLTTAYVADPWENPTGAIQNRFG